MIVGNVLHKGTRFVFKMIDRDDIETDIDFDDFIDFRICELLDRVVDEPCKRDPYELAYLLTEDVANTGSLNNSKEGAEAFLAGHLTNLVNQIIYECSSCGQLCNDPVNDPEAFQVSILITGIENKLAKSDILEIDCKDEIILNDDICKQIKESVGITQAREQYLSSLYTPNPDVFTLEAFQRDLDVAVNKIISYPAYLEKGFVDVDDEIKALVGNTVQDICVAGTNFVSAATKKMRDINLAEVKKNINSEIKDRATASPSIERPEKAFHAVACR